MSDFEPDAVETAAPKRTLRWWQKTLIGIGVTLVTLVLAALSLYNFGGMGGSANDPEIRQQYKALVDAGQIEPVERRFVIPIPGCTCHSDDPLLTEQHRNRRIRECSGCHNGGGPM